MFTGTRTLLHRPILTEPTRRHVQVLVAQRFPPRLAAALLLRIMTLARAHVDLAGHRFVDDAVTARLLALATFRTFRQEVLSGTAAARAEAAQVQVRNAAGRVQSGEWQRFGIRYAGVGAQVDGQAGVGAATFEQTFRLDFDRGGRRIVAEIVQRHDLRQRFERLRARYAVVRGELLQVGVDGQRRFGRAVVVVRRQFVLDLFLRRVGHRVHVPRQLHRRLLLRLRVQADRLQFARQRRRFRRVDHQHGIVGVQRRLVEGQVQRRRIVALLLLRAALLRLHLRHDCVPPTVFVCLFMFFARTPFGPSDGVRRVCVWGPRYLAAVLVRATLVCAARLHVPAITIAIPPAPPTKHLRPWSGVVFFFISVSVARTGDVAASCFIRTPGTTRDQ